MNKLFQYSALPLALLQACGAIAEVPDDGLELVERITVTATRKERLDTDLAMSVHGINKEQLNIDNGSRCQNKI